MRLYPARYQAAAEILDVHREMTMDLSRLARLRADADLVAHAMRVRLGLDSASAGGRFFELAAPFALAVAAACGGIELMRWYAGVAISPGSTWSQLATTDLRQGLHVVFLLLMCGGGIVALLEYWRFGSRLSVVGLLGFAAFWFVAPGYYEELPLEVIAAVLTALVILACPPQRRAHRKPATVAGAMAAIAWFPSALVLTRGFVVSTDYGAWPLLTLILTGVVCYARPSGLRTLAALAVASPLFLAPALISL
ncbi:hypothetical protein E1263_14085 [Kribbella antibiotica]|uniref:Uncharacterized protein n=1 Tax=Kribbella antibiotica TaxID=190195 RepID=A0A4R4ZM22_9ACTN|nr:hypothetical protein [Kribbella antibiotica]TDD59615.1 hypothetical protein E1263_14085 [Kribbella antibiotica]